MLYILSGASCAGKTTVYEQLEKTYPLRRVITTTTRAPRTNEVHGVDYFFITRDEFERLHEAGEFLEINEYAGNLYGTRWEQIREAVASPDAVFAIIDVNGAQAVMTEFPEAVSIFIEPESFEDLRVRMLNRGENTPEEIERRLEIAREEMKKAPLFKHRVVNHVIDHAVESILNIIK
ncbi:MAG: guanylate kinase [Clostridia bacterium]|nr:guanylate kinase [Clostridia bacterium]